MSHLFPSSIILTLVLAGCGAGIDADLYVDDPIPIEESDVRLRGEYTLTAAPAVVTCGPDATVRVQGCGYEPGAVLFNIQTPKYLGGFWDQADADGCVDFEFWNCDCYTGLGEQEIRVLTRHGKKRYVTLSSATFELVR